MMTPEEKILRSFFAPDGRLKQIPVKPAKRAVVFSRLAEAFDPGRRYPEAEVNQILLGFHEDYCTIRRELVDTGRMRREQNIYWRPKADA